MAKKTRKRAIGLGLIAFLGFCCFLPFLSIEVVLDLAPLSRFSDEQNKSSSHHSTKHLEFSFLDALADGLHGPSHGYIFDSRNTLTIELPIPAHIRGLLLVGEATREDIGVAVQFFDQHKMPVWVAHGQWTLLPAVPKLSYFLCDRTRCSKVQVTFSGAAKIAAIPLYAPVPRIVAWIYVSVLVLVLPIFIGGLFVLGVLGIGTLLRRWMVPRVENPALVVVLGLLGATLLSITWIVIPAGDGRDIAFSLTWIVAAIFGAINRAEFGDGGYRWQTFAMIWLILMTIAETYALSDDRLQPIDHFHAYFGAQTLASNATMPASLSQRPWLAQALFAPFVGQLKQLSFWGYVGFVAGVNSLSVVLMASVLPTLNRATRNTALGWFILLPGFFHFHCLGQRLLGGALAVLAITWLLKSSNISLTCNPLDRKADNDSDENTPSWLLPVAGIALTLGIGLHPSIVFVVVATSILLLVFRIPRRSAMLLRCLVIPVVAYAIWLAYMHVFFPSKRNDLLFYPIMTDLKTPFPLERSVVDVLLSLSPSDYLELLTNRVRHFRHYLHTDNWSPAPWTWGRWISLPNVITYCGCLLLLVRFRGRIDLKWLLIVVGAPLLFHHLFIGQAHPQFHISPAPFVALMTATAFLLANIASETQRGPWRAICTAMLTGIVIEVLLRAATPIYTGFFSTELAAPISKSIRLIRSEQLYFQLLSMLPFLWMLFMLFKLRSYAFQGTNCKPNVSATA